MLLLFLSPRFEFSANVFVVFVDDAAVDRLIGGIGFFKFRFNGNGLFSLSKLRGNCIVVSSLISVDDASTRFDEDVVVVVELFVFTPDDEEFLSTVRRSMDDDVSDIGRGGGGGANG